MAPQARLVLVHGEEFVEECAIIYGLVDPLEPWRVRYVGQTVKPPVARYLGHVGTKGESSARGAWIYSLIEAGRYPDMVLLEMVAPGANLDDRELSWIAALKEQGQADTNAPVPRWFLNGEPRPAQPWYVTKRRRTA